MEHKLRRIMCVDDEFDVLDITKECLETVGGFNVTCCSSGAEMFSRLKETCPDLILLDVMMPGMDGLKVLEEIQKSPEFSHVPVVFMTARVQPKELEEYKRLGSKAAIPKPFDPMQLSAQVEEIWVQCA